MLELMVVLVMVGIMAAMAFPQWGKIQARIKGKAARDELIQAFMLARSDAMAHRRASGILLDPVGMRYLRFVDSLPENGRYDQATERIIEGWTSLSKELQFVSVSSTESSRSETVRYCVDPPPPTPMSTGGYTQVFYPAGSARATFSAVMQIKDSPGSQTRIDIIPATGLVRGGR
jgi:type II secretory pathway pseudopilin PulG